MGQICKAYQVLSINRLGAFFFACHHAHLCQLLTSLPVGLCITVTLHALLLQAAEPILVMNASLWTSVCRHCTSIRHAIQHLTGDRIYSVEVNHILIVAQHMLQALW